MDFTYLQLHNYIFWLIATILQVHVFKQKDFKVRQLMVNSFINFNLMISDISRSIEF